MSISHKNKDNLFEEKPTIKIDTKELFQINCNFDVFFASFEK